MSHALNDRFDNYSEKNSQNSPEENLSFSHLVSGIAIPRGSNLSRIVGGTELYKLGNPLGTQQFERPGFAFDINGFWLSHNIVFEGSQQDRLRKQQIFEQNSFLLIKVNRQDLIKLPFAALVPYFFGNAGGEITCYPKQETTLFELPQILHIGSGVPVEFKLELHQEFQTDATIQFISSPAQFGTTRVVPDPAQPNVVLDLPNFYIALTTQAVERTAKVG